MPGHTARLVLRDVLAWLVVLAFLFPLFWWVLASFKPYTAIFAQPPVYADFEPSVENYEITIAGKSRINLEGGVGGAVAVLSAQVDDLTKTLVAAQSTAASSTDSLDGLTHRAEDVARRLELLVAAMHDLPDPKARSEPQPTPESATGTVFFRHPTEERAS